MIKDFALAERRLGDPMLVLDRVESSNNYAMGELNARPITEGTCYLALSQTAGKGQRGKDWYSTPGQSMLLSLVLQPVSLRPELQFPLSAAVALAGWDLMAGILGPGDCRIKWSNDLYWRDRKAGGILIENILRGNSWVYSVVGVGINLNQESFPAGLPNPASFFQAVGKTFDPVECARKFCSLLEPRYALLRSGGAKDLLSEYGSRLYRLDQTCRFRTPAGILEAVLRGVRPEGQLVLETREGIRLFGFGSVELIG
ncbi:MAG TPA: biotin--[acetyl-CoA-carboxylase] ligase [Chitinophagaceae bacterium]|nr:biotin--[acetyl-CoA-carboxylase] ligase [Chitinophagaceae bacterium]